jgi:hypothetical protein
MAIFLSSKEICLGTRKQTQIKESDNFLELDVWLPALNLGFEFQVNIFKHLFIKEERGKGMRGEWWREGEGRVDFRNKNYI